MVSYFNCRILRFLTPLSYLYGFFVSIRNLLYDKDLLKSRKFPVKIVSIGNLSVGGTGKTPAVEYVARLLLQRGLKPTIASRGYLKKSKGFVVVADGKDILSTVEDSGDEPYLMAKNLPSVPIVVDNNRERGIERAIEEFQPDYILLDDAFQHRAVERDLDILILNSKFNHQREKLIPAGILREPLKSLKRADVIIFSKTNIFNGGIASPEIPDISRRLLSFNGIHMPVSVDNPELGKSLPPDWIKGIAFCGIADPESFKKLLMEEGAVVVKFTPFPDHCKYGERELRAIEKLLLTHRSDILITTQKDYYKIAPSFKKRYRLFFLKIEFKMEEREEEFLNILLNI
ncbi:MAG: tetraacyldisaccharide 4'-kinase [Fidelibacterota bacterium]